MSAPQRDGAAGLSITVDGFVIAIYFTDNLQHNKQKIDFFGLCVYPLLVDLA